MAPTQDKEMMMRNFNNANYTVGRVLLVSPPQNEMLRRNYSRVFIAPIGEGTIDSIIFQGHRPIEGFTDVCARAIKMAGLKDASGNFGLRPQINPAVTGGFLQQHLISTGWLEDQNNTVYDIWVEVLIENEDLPSVDMKTFNGQPVDGFEENPLIIAVDVEELAPKFSLIDDGSQTSSSTRTWAMTRRIAGDQGQQAQGADDQGQGGDQNERSEEQRETAMARRPGRVTNPATDRRLKQNRDQPSTAMARRSDTDNSGETSQSGRMAGRPGRVRDPSLDMRLKTNRMPAQSQASAAGGR
jgi:hypothetical protein